MWWYKTCSDGGGLGMCPLPFLKKCCGEVVRYKTGFRGGAGWGCAPPVFLKMPWCLWRDQFIHLNFTLGLSVTLTRVAYQWHLPRGLMQTSLLCHLGQLMLPLH